MDIAKALTFVTEDKKWIEKILVAGLLVFSVIGILAVLGWMAEITRRVIRQDAEVLPEWGNLGKYFVDGLIVAAIGFVWMLPIILFFSCAAVLTAVVSSPGSDGGNSNEVLGTLLSVCIAFVTLPYVLAVSFLNAPMIGIYAMQGTFAEAVNPAKAWRLARANMGGFLVAWLLAGVVGFAAAIVGTILCLIGTYPLGAYAYAVSGHLYGQACREGMAGLPAT